MTPPLLVGRQDEIDDFRFALQEGIGAPERMTLLTGMRGTGKTVLLTAYEDVARSEGWLVISETAEPGMIDRLTKTAVPGLLAEIDEQHEPRPDFRYRMNQLLDAIEPEDGVLISIDEIRGTEDFELLSHTVQHLRREERNVAFVGAGLPSSVQTVLSADRPTTYLRRADRRHLGMLEADEVRAALEVPILDAGRGIASDALDIAVEGTRGYPLMVQLVGFETWQASRDDNEITAEHAQQGVATAQRRIGELVHEPALADLFPATSSSRG
ncbi:ATP-binding protein [Microbacterium oryzae]|uniref:ATP-binding protein n=1 Tax=Microbacterium oryzae TaxID=743009 RepID=UPI0015642E0E|nr:ATP-binding protein [Microbacterium oryzae]